MLGGSGWLGRALAHELVSRAGADPASLVLVGNSARRCLLDGTPLDVLTWDEYMDSGIDATVVVHMATLPREHLRELSTTEYLKLNRRFLQGALEVSRRDSVETVLHVSSGAALTDSGPYGDIKREQESAFASLDTGVNVMNARVWSVSGRFCTRPELFAFTDFVLQAKRAGIIDVRSASPIWRRYVDAGEFLTLCLAAALDGGSGVVDSGGTLVELHDLAGEVASHFDARVQGQVISGDEGGQAYHSDGGSMDQLAGRFGWQFLDLAGQIRRTATDL